MVLFYQHVLRLDQDALEGDLVKVFEGGKYRQAPDELWNQAVLQQVLGLDLTKDRARLAVLRSLHGGSKANGCCPASGRDDHLQAAKGAATNE
jgi:hypothetical protein